MNEDEKQALVLYDYQITDEIKKVAGNQLKMIEVLTNKGLIALNNFDMKGAKSGDQFFFARTLDSYARIIKLAMEIGKLNKDEDDLSKLIEEVQK